MEQGPNLKFFGGDGTNKKKTIRHWKIEKSDFFQAFFHAIIIFHGWNWSKNRPKQFFLWHKCIKLTKTDWMNTNFCLLYYNRTSIYSQASFFLHFNWNNPKLLKSDQDLVTWHPMICPRSLQATPNKLDFEFGSCLCHKDSIFWIKTSGETNVS